MIEGGFRGLLISFLLVGLFTFSMITFGDKLIDDNEGNESVIDHPAVQTLNTTIFGNLSDTQSQAQTKRESFEEEEPSAGFGTLLLFSLVEVARAFTSTFVVLYNVLFGFARDILGIPTIAMITIGATMLITVILLSWRLFKTGE